CTWRRRGGYTSSRRSVEVEFYAGEQNVRPLTKGNTNERIATMIRVLAFAFMIGCLATALSLVVVGQFCMDGAGRGFPAAVTHPAHGKEAMEFAYSGNKIEGMVVDVRSVGIDVATWSLVIGYRLASLLAQEGNGGNRDQLHEGKNRPAHCGRARMDT